MIRALLIGVTQYLDQNRSPSLHEASANTELLANLLVGHYGADRHRDVRVRIKPEHTTGDNLQVDIQDWLLADLGPGAIRVLAVSAHGMSFLGDGDATDDLFICSDDPKDGNALLQSEIDGWIERCPARGQVYCLFDCCRPKGLSQAQLEKLMAKVAQRARRKLIEVPRVNLKFFGGTAENLVPAQPKLIPDSRQWVAMKACAVEQSAVYTAEGGRFTRGLCAVLESAACSSPATTMEKACRKLYMIAGQDPELRGPADWLKNRGMFT